MSRAGALLATAVFAAACRAPEPPPPHAAGIALRLFEVAGTVEPPLDELFGPGITGDARTELLDNLDAVGATGGEARVVAEEPLEPSGVTAVDLERGLPGGGVARYAVHVRGSAETGFAIVWFAGPDVEWPTRSRRGSGLSTSSHRPPGPGDGSDRAP